MQVLTKNIFLTSLIKKLQVLILNWVQFENVFYTSTLYSLFTFNTRDYPFSEMQDFTFLYALNILMYRKPLIFISSATNKHWHFGQFELHFPPCYYSAIYKYISF